MANMGEIFRGLGLMGQGIGAGMQNYAQGAMAGQQLNSKREAAELKKQQEGVDFTESVVKIFKSDPAYRAPMLDLLFAGKDLSDPKYRAAKALIAKMDEGDEFKAAKLISGLGLRNPGNARETLLQAMSDPKLIAEQTAKWHEQDLAEEAAELEEKKNFGGTTKPQKETDIGDQPIGEIFTPHTPADVSAIDARQRGLAMQMDPKRGAEAILEPSKQQESPFAKISPKDYTPESLRQFALSKDPTVLVPREKPESEGKSPSVGTDREALAQEYGYPSFASAPGEAKVRINKEVKRREDERLQLQRQNINIQQDAGNLNRATTLRKEFEKQSGNFVTVRDSYNRLQAGSKNPSPAGDITMVFNFMKMLDPSSVIRESEYATAANASAVPDRIRNLWNRLKSGEKLTPEQRKDFLSQARGQYGSMLRTHKQLVGETRRIAGGAGINPDLVIIDYVGKDAEPTAEAEPAQAAKPKTAADFLKKYK